jgi:hypothetical protein
MIQPCPSKGATSIASRAPQPGVRYLIKRVWNAIAMQAADTHGLSRSPTRDAFQPNESRPVCVPGFEGSS